MVYTWKIVNGLVPNMTGANKITTYKHIRRGLLCNIVPVNNRCLSSIRSIKENSFCVRGPRLFNELPYELREFNGSLDTFKHMLDVWLKLIPDKPVLPHYFQPAAGNSVIEQLAQLRVQRI